MRLFSLLITLALLSINSFAQSAKRSRPVIYSTASDWQKITFRQTARLRPAQPAVSAAIQPERKPEPVVPQPTINLSETTQPGAVRPEVVRPSSVQPDVARPDVARPNAVQSDYKSTSTTQPGAAQPDAAQPDVIKPGSVQPDIVRPSVVAQPTMTQSDVAAPTRTNVPRRSNNPLAQPAAPDADVTRTSTSGSTDPGFRPAFTGDFATNRNGWKAGNKGDYNYQIGLGRYNIRKLNTRTQQVAFSYVPLPTDINLNTADMFTIKLDVLADSGRIPTGGLMFGIKDSLNFCAFTLNGKGEVSIVRVVNGETFSDYMPGDFFAPGVPVDRNRNRLIIRRKGNELHFYVNEQEVRSSPYPFRTFSGHSIGMLTSAYWTSFQKLSVTLGP